VIDVAGPVPLAVEGARLRALADGEPPPLPHEDPDIRAEVAAVTPDFTLGPGGPDSDLAVTLKTADMDHARQIALRLAPRCRRGIEIRTFLSERPRLTPAVPRSRRGAPHAASEHRRCPGCLCTGAVTVRGEATRAFGIMIVERRGGPAAWHPFSELTVG
jgi:hypothetical protein